MISSISAPFRGIPRHGGNIGIFIILLQPSQFSLFGNRRIILFDLLQSQPNHIELIAEKLTVRSILEPIANKYCLPMTIGRGYCSLSPRHAIAERFKKSGKDRLVLLLVSDFDPDGEEIAQSFARSLRDDFSFFLNVDPLKVMLTHEQVSKWELLPNEMEAKKESPQYQKFAKQFGNKVYELEAIDPVLMQSELSRQIEASLDIEAFNREVAKEREDAAKLQAIKSEVAKFLADFDIDSV